MRKVLITGGFGFIGSNLCRYWFEKYPDDQVIIIDAMTYAARPNWVNDYFIDHAERANRFSWMVLDLANSKKTASVVKSIEPDIVIHLAAESHVCRSIETPRKFLESNVVGTYNLLEACKEAWNGKPNRLHIVSTDEVYGELPVDDKLELFHEEHIYAPRSPYAASKAAADHLAMAFHHTYGMNITISNCSNNFGPNQDTEKLIPKTIERLLRNEPVELYGDGSQIRDWLWVDDHCRAIDAIVERGRAGQTYCVGGNNELTNKEIVTLVADVMCKSYQLKIEYSNKRPTDDKRYGIDTSKIELELDWVPSIQIEKHLWETVGWYRLNRHRVVP